jgi:hypothetical protein
MIEIERIIFCDEVQQAPFGKTNLIGCIVGRKVAVNRFPYVFQTKVFMEGFIEGETDSAEITLSVVLEKPGEGHIEQPFAQAQTPRADHGGQPLLLTAPLSVQLDHVGHFQIKVAINGVPTFTRMFTVIQGDAPYSKNR